MPEVRASAWAGVSSLRGSDGLLRQLGCENQSSLSGGFPETLCFWNKETLCKSQLQFKNKVNNCLAGGQWQHKPKRSLKMQEQAGMCYF